MKLQLIILLAVISLGTAFGQKETVIVGHRGAYLAPENTLASYTLAWEMDVLAAECDIMLTSDDQVIVFHDKKGKRLTGHDFVVKESTYEEIKDYPIILKKSNLEKYSGQRIPLLSDLLQTIPDGHTLVIEIKTGKEILPHLQEVIRKYWNTGNITFIAFDYETILATKEIYPDIPCYYLSAFGIDLSKKQEEIMKGALDGVNLRHKIITEKMVGKFNKAGKEVWCWTVNDPADAKKMIQFGVKGITTDRPKWLYDELGLPLD